MHFTFSVFEKTRGFYKNYLDKFSLEDLNKIPEGFKNNIIWNIGHIVVTEQLLVYKLSGLPMLVSDELVTKYRKDTKPEGFVGQDEVDEIAELLFSTIKKTQQDYTDKVFKNYNKYTVSTTGNTLTIVDEAINFALFHEGMHLGYILALKKSL